MSNSRLVAFARRHRLVSRIVNSVGRSRALDIARRINPWVTDHLRILDIGTGTGHVAEALRGLGHDVTGCDIVDLRFVDSPLVVADGVLLPFADKTFDATLLSTVLHHAPAIAHKNMLLEGVRTLRTGGRLVILEDVYNNRFELWCLRVVDAISNGEFFGEPHSNRTFKEWKQLLDGLGLRVEHMEEFVSWFGVVRIRQALIVVDG